MGVHKKQTVKRTVTDTVDDAACCYTNLEGILLDGPDHIFEQDPRSERVAVVDDGFIVRSIPAVQLHASAALLQSPGSDQTSNDQYMHRDSSSCCN